MDLQPPWRVPSDDALTIRATRPADCEEIAALACLPGYRWGTLRLPYQTVEETRKFIENLPVGNVSLVAVLDGQIVANGGLDRHAGRRAHVAGLGMGVHDEYQGRGIGSRLLGELLNVADNWLNLRRIELTVYVDNAAAIAIYRRCGFEIEGTHSDYAFRGGSFVDAHAMARVRR